MTARIVGGQAYNGASSGSVIIGPSTWVPATATNGSGANIVGYTNPNNAKVADANAATATITSGQTASIVALGVRDDTGIRHSRERGHQQRPGAPRPCRIRLGCRPGECAQPDRYADDRRDERHHSLCIPGDRRR